MVDGRSRISRALAPLLLAALTLVVFSKLQYYGPESTLRQFHEAAIRGDLPTLDATTVQGTNSGDVLYLAGMIRDFAAEGSQMQPLAMTRSPGAAICEVAYFDVRDQMLVHIFWKLVLRGRNWRVDAAATFSNLNPNNPARTLGAS